MNRVKKTHVCRSGLVIDVDYLRKKADGDDISYDFCDHVRLAEGKTFTNGLMVELRKHLNFLSGLMFFKFIKATVPQPTQQILAEMDEKTFKSKLQVFERNTKKAQRRSATYEDYLLQPYVFTTVRRESPRKRAMILELGELKKRKDDLLESNAENELEISRLENNILEQDRVIIQAKEKLLQLEADRLSFANKVAGLKSGICRSKSVKQKALSVSSTTHHGSCDTCDMATSTMISGVSGDMVVLKETTDAAMYTGKKYYGGGTSFKKLTSGIEYVYAEFPLNKNKASDISRKEVQKRAKFVMDVACNVASSSKEDSERNIILTEMVRLHKDVFHEINDRVGLSTQQTLTPVQAINIKSLLRLPMNKVRNLRRCLSNLNMNIFPNERKMREAQAPLVSHVQPSCLETGLMGLKRTAKCDNVSPRPFVRVKNITYLEEILKTDTLVEDPEFGGKLWLLFAGDKGGQHMKFHVEIINSVNSGSPDNVHIYCMFEASDSCDNMWKVWIPFREQLKIMQEPGFLLNDMEVEVFLGGDLHFLDDNLGHQGSSATWPSSMDKVKLSHLQKDHQGNKLPHTPLSCPVEMRTVSDYVHNLAESGGNDLRKNGPSHFSVVAPMLFPLKSLDQLVPPGLHIMLGVVLLLYNELLGLCTKIDEGENSELLEAERQRVSEQWEVSSLQLSKKMKELTDQAEIVLEMEDNYSRYLAVYTGDDIQNTNLIKQCDAANCYMDDDTAAYITCEKCEKKFHMSCECLSSVEEMALSDGQHYECVCCSGVTDVADVFIQKISKLLDEEDVLKKETVLFETACSNLQARYVKVVGIREKLLNSALAEIKVVRQAYHGNVMVGNHCHIVVKKYHILTRVISDYPLLQSQFNEIFELFGKIVALMSARRFLSENEIDELERLCHRFGHKFPEYFPNRFIIRKIHELIFNVPIFA